MNIFTKAKHFNLSGDETLADYEAAEIANTIVEQELSKLRHVNEALNKISHKHADMICADGTADGDETFEVAVEALAKVEELK